MIKSLNLNLALHCGRNLYAIKSQVTVPNIKFIIVNNYLMFSPKIGNVSKTRPSIVEKSLSANCLIL